MGSYRVTRWATGKVDRRVPIAILDHPELDPLGVYVHPPDKVGVDAGHLDCTTVTGVHVRRAPIGTLNLNTLAV